MKAGDFSELYGSERYSDMVVVLYEEDESADNTQHSQGNKRRRGAEELLPCHGLVLWANSSYFRTKMDNWSATDAADSCRASKSACTSTQDSPAQQKQQIELPVPKGQLAAGQLLIKAMYQAAPDLSAVDQAKLLQVLLLADRYEVPKAMEAAAAAFKAIPAQDFAWEAVTAVYNLPASCFDMPACSGMFAAAAAKIQHVLGDLELVWADEGKKQLLLQLPFAGLKQLLPDQGTRVASENTVVYTIERWCDWQNKHLSAEQRPSDEQLRELVGLVRMKHCSPSYVGTIFAASKVSHRALQWQEMAQLVAFVGVAGAKRSHRHSNSGSDTDGSSDSYSDFDSDGVPNWPVLKTFPAWAASSRPASARSSEILDWRITASELREAFETAIATKKEGILHSPIICYSGLRFKLQLHVENNKPDSGSGSSSQGAGASSQQGRVELGIFTHVVGLDQASELAVCRVKRQVTVERVQGRLLAKEFGHCGHDVFTAESAGWGRDTKLGAVDSWAEFQAALDWYGALLADGGMRVKLKIQNIQ